MTAGGERVRGVLAAPTEQAVLAELESRRLIPMSLSARADKVARGRGFSLRALGTAYGQMGDLLKAGVPLLRSLRLLANRRSKPRLAEVFGELADRVSSGEDLAKAMADRPNVFPNVHVAMVKAGEKGGFLEPVLHRLGQMVMAQADLRGKVIAATMYPMILAFVGSSLLVVVFVVFVPKFKDMLKDVPGELPAVTKAVFALGDLVAVGWPALPVVIAGVVAGVVAVGRSARLRRTIDVVRTRMPVVGPLVRTLAAARFCRMLGTMLDNGVPLITAMTIAREAAGNVLMERAIEEATEAVRQGQALSPPLASSGLFDDDVLEMISVGESANNLGEVLLTIARTTEERVDRLLGAALQLVGPLLILLLAGAVGTVAAALVIPMTRMARML